MLFLKTFTIHSVYLFYLKQFLHLTVQIRSNMNFLAHIYLSGEDEKLMVGNFIGDYVKGKNYENYPSPIREGIILHRQVDSFTDSHPNFRNAKKLLVEEFGLYSGIVIDLFYDYFLAKNWNNYSDTTLKSFSRRTHAVLLSNFFYLPKRVQGFLPFLIKNRRLESYATISGIYKSLDTMSRYTSFPDKAEIAKRILVKNLHILEENFIAFFPEIIGFVEKNYNVEIKKPDSTTTEPGSGFQNIILRQ